MGAALLLLVLAIAATAFVLLQGKRSPTGRADYVALGSSFAAGAGLGPLQDGSPLLCARSINGYPPRLARLTGMSLVDMSCGGAVTKHLLHGGQFFQGSQLRAIGAGTGLVTITVGGNDLGYIGDLSMMAARNTSSVFGRGVGILWGGPRTERNYAKLRSELLSLMRSIHVLAPGATIVVASYPTILPPAGTCPRLSLTRTEADMMRQVADRFAATMRVAVVEGGAILVDMHRLGAGHHACSADPWTYGWANAGASPFHPTARGAEATAKAIARALKRSPDAVTAIDRDDAAGHQARRVRGEE